MKNIQEAKIKRLDSEIGRLYEYDLRVGCAVSLACSLIVPKYLQEYFKKNSPQKQEKHREETAALGSNGHALIEKQAKGQDVKACGELKGWFDDWNKTQEQYQITAEMSEVMVFSKTFAYGGQIDRVGMFEGKRCIIDFKTGSYSHLNLWKTEAYRQAYIEMTGDIDIGAVVLHLPRPDLVKRGHKVRHYTIERHETCFLNFLCAYQTFKMLYYNDLIKAGMTEKDVFSPLPFLFYEREYGAGVCKEDK